MYQHLRVAVAIPAYNEERAIADVVAGIPAWVDDVLGSPHHCAEADSG
jgi:hypothetical protein